MAIDLHKEHYDSDGNRAPLTVYPESNSPEIYPQREIYPQPKTVEPKQPEKFPPPKQEADIEASPKITIPETTDDKIKKAIIKSMNSGFIIMVLFCISAYVFHDGNGETEKNAQNVQEQLFSQNDVAGVSVDSTGNINVVLCYSYSSSGDISVKSVTDSYSHCVASNDNGILNISFERKVYAERDNNGTVTVTFPARFYGDVNVTSSGKGSVTAEAGETLHIETEDGSIEVSDLRSDEVRLITESGNISVNNSVTDILDIGTDSGSIYIADSEAASSLTARASDGNFIAKGMASSGKTEITAFSKENENGNGTVYCENITLGENADITGSEGLRLENAEFHNISVESLGRIDIFPTLPKELYWIKKTGNSDLYLENERLGGNAVSYNPEGEYKIDITARDLVNLWSDDDNEEQPQQ